jgi:anti-anti-sigma regulatory factor
VIDLTGSAIGGLPEQRVFTAPLPSPEGQAPDGSIRLVPLADLDVSTEADARAELAEACEAPGSYHWVVVDGVPEWFVDVRGLAVLLDSAAHAAARGRELVVVAPPKSLRQSVAALAVGDRLRLVESLSELIA